MRNEVMGLSRMYGGKPWVLSKHVGGVAHLGDIVECVGIERHGKDRRPLCVIKVGVDQHLVDASPEDLLNEPSLDYWGPRLASRWWAIDGHQVYVHEFEAWHYNGVWARIADGVYVDNIKYLELRTCPTPSRGPLTLMEASQLLDDGWQRIQIE